MVLLERRVRLSAQIYFVYAIERFCIVDTDPVPPRFVDIKHVLIRIKRDAVHVNAIWHLAPLYLDEICIQSYQALVFVDNNDGITMRLHPTEITLKQKFFITGIYVYQI